LIVIVLLSLMDSFISSVIFSAVAVGCLNFFFTKPLYSFRIDSPGDFWAVATFLFTSLVVTLLVRLVRRLGEAQREQARLLDLTRDTVFVRDMNDVITYWNHGAEELYEWNREEAMGQVTHRLLQTRFPMPLDAIMDQLLRPSSPQSPTAWAWDCRSAVRSSKPTEDGCGRPACGPWCDFSVQPPFDQREGVVTGNRRGLRKRGLTEIRVNPGQKRIGTVD
jgi:PAS domain-containing protein